LDRNKYATKGIPLCANINDNNSTGAKNARQLRSKEDYGNTHILPNCATITPKENMLSNIRFNI